MKKILLVAAIVALSQQATAEIYTISSNIEGVQMWLGGEEKIGIEGGSVSDFSLKGTIYDDNDDGVPNDIDITLTGEMTLTAGPDVNLTFKMGSNLYKPGEGLIMNRGTITVSTNEPDDVPDKGFVEFEVIDLSEVNMLFLAGEDGFVFTCPTKCTAGLLLEGFTADINDTQPLPGFNDAFGTTGWHSGVSVVKIFNNTAGMFLKGTVTRAPVPVPAAAWLFGSALLGLAGIGRRKK